MLHKKYIYLDDLCVTLCKVTITLENKETYIVMLIGFLVIFNRTKKCKQVKYVCVCVSTTTKDLNKVLLKEEEEEDI